MNKESEDKLKQEGSSLIIALVVVVLVAWIVISLALGVLAGAGWGWLFFGLGWVLMAWRIWILLKNKAQEIKDAKVVSRDSEDED